MRGVDGAEPARRAGRRRVLGKLVLARRGRRHEDETAGRHLVSALLARGSGAAARHRVRGVVRGVVAPCGPSASVGDRPGDLEAIPHCAGEHVLARGRVQPGLDRDGAGLMLVLRAGSAGGGHLHHCQRHKHSGQRCSQRGHGPFLHWDSPRSGSGRSDRRHRQLEGALFPKPSHDRRRASSHRSGGTKRQRSQSLGHGPSRRRPGLLARIPRRVSEPEPHSPRGRRSRRGRSRQQGRPTTSPAQR